MGVPVSGISAGGVQTGYRYDTRVGLLEYRMVNLQPYEEATITGQPIASIQITGVPTLGDLIALSLTDPTDTLSSVSYEVTENDLLSQSSTADNGPLYSIALNTVIAINQAHIPYAAAANPPVDLYAASGYGPTYSEVIIQGIGLTSFSVSVESTGGTGAIATSQGVGVYPQAAFDGVTYNGMIPILNFLESAVASKGNAYLSYLQADVVKFRPDEIMQRASLYDATRQKLADYLGVPLYAGGNVSGVGRGSTA